MNVVVRGPLLSCTGYGEHSRQVFQWALSKGWNVHAVIVPWGMCTYHINPNTQNGLIGRVMNASAPLPEGVRADLSLQIQLPDEWDPGLAKVNIGVTAGVEADRCSQNWVAACRMMDHVIVPSTFTRSVFLNSGLEDNRISCVPEAYTCGHEKTPGYQSIRDGLESLPTKFNLLVFGQLTGQTPETDRKNTFYCLKWISEAFKNDPDVGIIVKTNMGRLTVQDREVTTNIFLQLLREIRPGPYPRFYLAHGLMDNNEITALYECETVKALVAPTRGEGWGLPILDAAVCGLPVMATAHSGHMDFMKKVKFLDLDYDEIDVPQIKLDGRCFVEGARWVEPKEGNFKSRLMKLRKGSAKPREWAQAAAPTIREEYSLPSIFKEYDSVVGAIVDRS